MKGLRSKNVLVTGATSGIGRACAVRFAQEGANVGINYRSDPEAARDMEGQVRACGVKALALRADVSSEEDNVRMFESAIKEFGCVDILVNNAGIQIEGAAHEIDTQDFDRVVSVNLKGAYVCAREAIKHFLSRGEAGVIINISSVHEIIPRPKYIGYSVSKGGMRNLTRTLALEYADRGIRVNAIAPGATVTPINRNWVEDPKKKAEVERHIPLGRAGTPEDVAAVAAFLASEEAAYITGQTLFIDGGLTLYADFREPWSG